MPISRIAINASPLITLYKSQLITLLPQLFTEIHVPSAVWQEVTACKNDIAAQCLPTANWAIKTDVGSIDPLVASWDLGAGESELLSYVLSQPNYTAMMDDAAARRCAISLKIPTLGTAGMLVLAKRKGLIQSVADPIQKLRDSGLWLSDSLVNLLKQQAGED